MTTASTIFARAYEALDNEDLEQLRAALDEAVAAGVDEDDARLGHLRFMVAWLDENTSDDQLEQQLAEAGDLLDSALQLPDGSDAARIVLDITDALGSAREFDDAEHALRRLSEREDVSPEVLGAACIIRAHILLDHHEDPEEALAVLEQAPASIQQEPGFASLHAAVLHELDRGQEAIELLERARTNSDEVELQLQLGLTLRDLGREQEALKQLFEVRRRDLANFEIDPDKPVPNDEVADLRRRVEDVLDTLPDPVMNKVASATIRIERWPSEAAIEAGIDPRAPLAFLGKPGENGEGKVEAIVVYRDTIVAQIEDDDEIFDMITEGLVEEFGRFFDLELIPGV